MIVDGAELFRFIAAFGLIALVLYAFAVFSRRGLRAGTFLQRDRLVEVIETTPLPHASSLHVVKLGDAYYAIGRTEGGISVLSEIPKEVVDRRADAGAARKFKLLAPRAR